jgi:hypothetical protein
MTTIPERLETLRQRLTGPGRDVRTLSRDQLLVTRDLVAVPAEAGKAPTYVPGPHGYQVHVACRPDEEHREIESRSQRLTGPLAGPGDWDPATDRLAVAGSDLHPQWTVRNTRGEVVTVRVHCGSDQVRGEVDAVLAHVEAVLLS